MAIWHYEADRLASPALGPDALVSLYFDARQTHACPYCHHALTNVVEQLPDDDLLRTYGGIQQVGGPGALDVFGVGDPPVRAGARPHATGDFSIPATGDVSLFEKHLRICPVCGWWVQFEEFIDLGGREAEHSIKSYGGIAGLKIFDLGDVGAPLAEIRTHLVAHYEDRFSIDPRLFEQVVADVFRGLGYQARVTAYSGDDGIDVVLDGPGDTTIGVQVKRYKNRIKVAQIRELTGALVINKHTRGIFVTTSDFESGGERTAGLSADAGVPIELVNAERFYEALRLRQLADPESLDAVVERLRTMPPRLIHTQTRGGRRSAGPFLL